MIFYTNKGPWYDEVLGSAVPGIDEAEADVSPNPAQGSKNEACSKVSVKFLTSPLLEISF